MWGDWNLVRHTIFHVNRNIMSQFFTVDDQNNLQPKTSLIFLLDGKGYNFLITRILTEHTTSSNQEYYYSRMFLALCDKNNLQPKTPEKQLRQI